MLVTGIVILIIIGAAIFFINGRCFGSLPSIADLKKMQRLPYFREGQIQNLTSTPSLTEGAGFFSILKEFLFDKSKQNIPPAPLPSRKTDLLHIDRNKNILVWFGHSSYFMQIDGKEFWWIRYLAETHLPCVLRQRVLQVLIFMTPLIFPISIIYL